MKKIKWLVQDVGLIQTQLYRKYDALTNLGYPCDPIGVIKGIDKITNLENVLEDNTIYVLSSGIKVLSLIQKANKLSDLSDDISPEQDINSVEQLELLKNGMFYNEERFDQNFYSKLNLPLINSDAIFLPIKENLSKTFDKDVFIKPSRDLKAFTGGVLKQGVSIESFIQNITRQSFWKDEHAIIANLKDIDIEYRFFVVEKEVITGSVYNINNKPTESTLISDYVLNIANEYAKLYQPHDIFTMDLALMKDGTVKIVEYNCFNCSGVYLCDLSKIYPKIKEYMIKKYC